MRHRKCQVTTRALARCKAFAAGNSALSFRRSADDHVTPGISDICAALPLRILPVMLVMQNICRHAQADVKRRSPRAAPPGALPRMRMLKESAGTRTKRHLRNEGK
jgi:hypothetical protein